MKRGFTLIELLIVIVIVGLLVTVALPQYKRTAERGRVAVGTTALRQLADRANALFLLQETPQYPANASFTNEADFEQARELFDVAYSRNGLVRTSATITLVRKTDSGWDYAPFVELSNGEIVSMACRGTDCEDLGLGAEVSSGDDGSGTLKPIDPGTLKPITPVKPIIIKEDLEEKK